MYWIDRYWIGRYWIDRHYIDRYLTLLTVVTVCKSRGMSREIFDSQIFTRPVEPVLALFREHRGYLRELRIFECIVL